MCPRLICLYIYELIEMKSRWLYIVLVLCLSGSIFAQQFRFLKEQQPYVHIPFDFFNNFIIINVRLNGLPLKFIVDTGAEYTILFQKDIADLLGMEYGRRVRLMGADMSTELYARVLPNSSLLLEDQCHIMTQLLVLEEDFYEMDRLIGMPIAGVIGGAVLRNFVLKIDYLKPELSLYHPRFFRAPNGFQQVPLEIEKSKPFFTSRVTMANGTTKDLRLLLDSGASLAALLFATEENGVVLPDSILSGVLGHGLGGRIQGHMGRVDSLQIGPYGFARFLGSYQRLAAGDSILQSHSRDGVLGNALLSRFTLIIDYKQEELLLKPNRLYKKKIRYDRSGLILISSGSQLKDILVLDLIADSPAYKAGIRPGDEITHVNGVSVHLYSLERVLKKMSGKSGRRIRLRIKKSGSGERVQHSFVLKDLL
jgi:hypothetical protein